MRKTRQRSKQPSSKKTLKYRMKGCGKKCKICKKTKNQNGGCMCQAGGTSLGFFQNIQNIGSQFLNNIVGVYNGFQTIPQPISANPWKDHYLGRRNFKY